MKQGRAATHNTAYATTRPVERIVSPGGVSRLGIEPGPFTRPEPIFEGRGISAPRAESCSHPCGSQGKH